MTCPVQPGRSLNALRLLLIGGTLVVVAAAGERLGAALGPADTPEAADVVRFLEQATWGPTPELVEHVRRVGFEGFLEEQFNAPASGYPALPAYPTTRDATTCPNGSACQRDNYTMYLRPRWW